MKSAKERQTKRNKNITSTAKHGQSGQQRTFEEKITASAYASKGRYIAA